MAVVFFNGSLSDNLIEFPAHFFESELEFGDLNVLIFNDDLPLIKNDVLETFIDSGFDELGSGLIANHGYQEFIREDLFVCLLECGLE